MSINQLQIDIEEHFRLFERVPLKAAWARRDTKVSLLWTGACFFSLVTALIELPADTLNGYWYVLPPILTITMICALQMSEVYDLIRAEHLGAGTTASLEERLHLRQRWLCERYQCTPIELVGKAQELRRIWEERQEIRKLASNDTMGPRFKAFFRLPDAGRFITSLLTVAAIFATLITLGGSIDSIFDALQNWKAIVLDIVIVSFLLAELVLFWIMVTGMIHEMGPSILEQLGLLRSGNRRVYRYLLSLHLASEPIMPFGRKLPHFLKLISLCFEPVSLLLPRFKARIGRLRFLRG
jgi:hypothetical protein